MTGKRCRQPTIVLAWHELVMLVLASTALSLQQIIVIFSIVEFSLIISILVVCMEFLDYNWSTSLFQPDYEV